ncbi:conserved hypothetical protein [Vibrio nigripulchritudo MADA3029]|uniref:nuclear transport factor 2 family protein n=1 Tax=Vibrio nigripulchritudo TaxID=28173 RepID=UPI0003B1BF0D|nr:DUF4440 domain-containing protein [Vibrio nigripulchritudo]CCN50220.1 conserved hypothetical protein [Vibrio nigripulchritudo MADA3020]CCN53353.1 conserved hypothetical protein [Vibrio nigripulchritudo MADA3021]CCN60160.1 conserved hypothetical protein [Vibrio nigripulchritudo MADA3029]
MDILIEQEKALHQPSVRKNGEEIHRLLHPEFVEVGKSGVTYNFEDMLKNMEQEPDIQPPVHSQDFVCMTLKPSVQMLLYKTALINEQGEYFDHAKRSSIWMFTGEGWQLVYHQGTLCEAFEVTQ